MVISRGTGAGSTPLRIYRSHLRRSQLQWLWTLSPFRELHTAPCPGPHAALALCITVGLVACFAMAGLGKQGDGVLCSAATTREARIQITEFQVIYLSWFLLLPRGKGFGAHIKEMRGE